jgi:small subunit ribosomal protein S19
MSSRAVWKGPFVEPKLLKKIDKSIHDNNHAPIKTWARSSAILPNFVGLTFSVHNGRKFIPVLVTEKMVGKKLGEFAPTRTFSGHGNNRK